MADYKSRLRQGLIRYWPVFRAKSVLYGRLIRLERPIGWLLLLWPTLWALWLANDGAPSLRLLFVFVTGVFIARSLGVVINDLADKDFDPHVTRTRNRPLACGEVSVREARALAAGLAALALLLVLSTNLLTLLLCVPAAGLILLYPLMKRYTYLPQIWLGCAFGWGIPMAFSASVGNVPATAWLIFATNMLWTLIYDTMYAMVDREDDVKVGIKSTAILLDDADRIILGVMQLMLVTGLYSIGLQFGLDQRYRLALALIIPLLIYQQFLIRKREPAGCFKAFLNNNWLGLIIFAGIALDTMNDG